LSLSYVEQLSELPALLLLLALELHLLLDLKVLKHLKHLGMLLLHALKILEEGVPVFSEMVFFLLDFFELLPGPFSFGR